ncbi:MAG: aminotransferase class V-fold PLP-dependent enzyme, partial [Lachnospiraceae bacterium]|nr:aminotransferase class V-fold PLP-dependent enzyme [Lachnospiraceae bacterium]
GSVQNVEEIGKIIKSKNKNIIFHTDAVQGLGKIKINCKKSYIDLLSASSHKFHGPKGVGLLYKKSDVRIKPLIYGGGQQDNLRSGTLNTVGIVGTVKAIDMIYNDFDNEIKNLYTLRDRLIDRLNDLHNKYNNININTKKTDSFAPHIVSVSFKGIRSEVMLHALEEKGIYVSAGSACSSHRKKKSGTLTSIGLSDEMINSTIRVSFSKYNVVEEVDKFINEVDTLIPRLKLK